MKVKECKIGKRVLYRGHIITIKNNKKDKILLSNGDSAFPKYLKPA